MILGALPGATRGMGFKIMEMRRSALAALDELGGDPYIVEMMRTVNQIHRRDSYSDNLPDRSSPIVVFP